MNKNLLLTVLLSFLALGSAIAQCTPVPFPGPALTNPDASQGIPPAFATFPYSQIINLRIPADTIVLGTTLPIDSVGIDSIKGVPSAFSYVTNSANDYWPGGTFGCIVIQGTPSNADIGTYTLTVYASIYLGHNAANKQSYVVNYDFKVRDSISAGFAGVTKEQFIVRQNAPNPFDSKTLISFQSPRAEAFSFEVFSIDGKLIRHEEINAEAGVNEITFTKGDLPSGLYIYQIKNDSYTVRKRMIIR